MTIGDILREAREKKGLSIKDVQEKTKIRSKYIKALEEEQFGLIPGDTYIKVFLKGYARFLGLNGEYLVKEYVRLSKDRVGEEPDKVFEKQEIPSQNKNKKRNKFLMIFLLAAIIITVIIGMFTLFYNGTYEGQFSSINIPFLKQDNNPEQTGIEDDLADSRINIKKDITGSQEPANDRSDKDNPVDNQPLLADTKTVEGEKTPLNEKQAEGINKEQEAEIIEEEAEGINEVQEAEIIEEEEITINEDEVPLNDEEVLPDNNKEAQKRVKAEPAEDTGAIINTDNSQGIIDRPADSKVNIVERKEDIITAKEISTTAETIKLIITEKCWLRVKEDGKVVFEGILNKGESREFSGNDDLWLRIGNAGGVKAQKGDKILGPWGKSGEVINKTLSFKKDG